MSLFKRHIGRRVAGVGVGVALLVLGLEAPAMADPAVTAISPTSGPVGCVVAVTGTGFDQAGAFAVATVNFTNATGIDSEAAIFHVVSDTEIWTTVPAAATNGPITVTDGNGTASSSGVFTITLGASPDPCGPTITSFDPTCGVVGTVVTITGTNLLKSSGDDGPPVVAPAGGDVKFNPYASNAVHTGGAESPTKLVVNVPSSAVDGPIRVTTFSGTGGTVTSTDSFDVVTDPALCAAAVPFARSITLRLRDALVARGKVSAATVTPPAPAGCTAAVPVKIQRRVSGHWKTVGKTTTSDTGAYRKKIRNRHGKYRSLAPSVTLASGDVCGRAKSKVVKH